MEIARTAGGHIGVAVVVQMTVAAGIVGKEGLGALQ